MVEIIEVPMSADFEQFFTQPEQVLFSYKKKKWFNISKMHLENIIYFYLFIYLFFIFIILHLNAMHLKCIYVLSMNNHKTM